MIMKSVQDILLDYVGQSYPPLDAKHQVYKKRRKRTKQSGQSDIEDVNRARVKAGLLPLGRKE